MKLIFKYCKEMIQKYPILYTRAILMVLLITCMNSIIPYGMRIFINRMTESYNSFYIFIGLFIFAVFLIATTFFNIKLCIFLDELGGKYITDITLDVEMTLANTSQYYIDEIGNERIKHILFYDSLEVFRVIGHHIPSLIGNVLTIFISFTLAAFYHYKVAFIIAIATAGGFILSFFSRAQIAKKAGMTNKQMKTYHETCNYYVDSLPLIQTNNIQSYFFKKSTDSIHDFITASQKEDWTMVFWSKAVGNYNTLFNIALSALLVLPITGGSIINLVFFTMLTSMITSLSQDTELLFQQIMKSEVSFDNIENLRKLPARQKGLILGSVQEIIFENVQFAYYGASENILDKICCTLRKGNVIRLIGGNGSGKSTFIKMITGIYQPNFGRITINGRELNEYSKESLNNQILYINQDETFLNETISDYLTILNENREEKEKMQHFFRLLNLDSLERNIEKEGMSLSVGQRKKLLILKMLLRADTASVIILDEVEAGLDQKTREIFISLLNGLIERKNKIIIMIEHEKHFDFAFDQIINF